MQIQKRAIEDNAVDGSKFLLLNNQAFRIRNKDDNGNVDVFVLDNANNWVLLVTPKIGGSNVATEAYVTAALNNKANTSLIGASDGIAPLGSDAKIPAAYLPSYVDDVLNYPTLGDFPATGVTGVIYINEALNLSYRWTGSAYTPITSVISSTDDVPEGATNKYHTTTRARTAAVLNSTAGTETDQAASVAAMKAYIASLPSGARITNFLRTITGTDVTNGYFDINVDILGVINVLAAGWPPMLIVTDYTVALLGGGVSRINFAAGGDMLNLVSGDKVVVTYFY